MAPELSVVIPIHNESAFLPVAVPELIHEMATVGRTWELLLMENGSTDGTAHTARTLLEGTAIDAKVMELEVPDYGNALLQGMLTATGEWIVMFDIDYFSGPFVSRALETGADIVIASKRADGSDDRRTLLRRAGTWGFNLTLRAMFGSQVGDTHGMKVLRRASIDGLLPQVVSRTDLFDTELVLRAERAGVSIAELPIVVEEKRDARSSFVRRIPRTLRGLWRLRGEV